MYGFHPKNKPTPAPYGARGVDQARALIPAMQAMGFAQMPVEQPQQMLANGGRVRARDEEGGGLSREATMAAIQRQAREAAQAQAQEGAKQRSGVGALPADFLRNPMAILRERERQAGVQSRANGGVIRGPGTGTSDSIPDEMEPGTYILPADTTAQLGLDDDKVPVRVSNGEYELPPEQVQAIGAAVLDVVKGATHTPVAQGFRPRGETQAFADGGRVKREEEQERLRRQTEMYVRGAQEAAATRPAVPLAAGPSATAPAQAAAPMAAPAPGPSALYMQDRAQEIQGQWGQGQYAQAAGTAARTAVQGAGMYGLEIADKVGSPWVDAARGFGRGLLGSEANAAPAIPAPAPAAATAASVIAPRATTVPTPGTVANPVNGAVTQPDPRPMGDLIANQAQAVSTPTTGNKVRPGVYQHGRGQYSDNAADMGFAPGRTGQPSAQNIAAADALAGRYEQSVASQIQREQNAAAMRPGGGPVAPGSFTGGFSGVIGQQSGNGNMWSRTPEQQRRDAEVQASSIHRQTAANGLAALKGLDAREIEGMRGDANLAQEALRGQSGMAQEALRQDGSLQREGMQQQGANTRDAARGVREGEELALKREAQGFTTRAAAQAEQLRNVLLDPKATPEQRRAAQENLRAISGAKTEDNRFTVVPGGQEWDAGAGAMRNVPARVLNNQTGQFVDQPGQGGAPVVRTPADLAKLPKGAQFMDEQGRMRVKN